MGNMRRDKTTMMLERHIKKDRGISIANVVAVDYSRIPNEERDAGRHYYSIRHADECGMTAANISKSVWVNHWGDIVTREPLTGFKDGVLVLTKAEAEFIEAI